MVLWIARRARPHSTERPDPFGNRDTGSVQADIVVIRHPAQHVFARQLAAGDEAGACSHKARLDGQYRRRVEGATSSIPWFDDAILSKEWKDWPQGASQQQVGQSAAWHPPLD